ncbi:uncharacterized protein LOC111902191 [Lactuca sativa]|uniref:uncharacterized protein LOC111902191 n=1 Tax=Lactuca sativa TaxID=4236 RepID=UPI000CD7F3AA|nr:uncharacterized protein LOC111902191 [Lactuca sativa]
MELFNIHACAYIVLHHINLKSSCPANIDESTWLRLDAVIKEWIYTTISLDLMKNGATAQELWNRLEEIFQDKNETRADYIEEQFNTTRQDSFSNINDYYFPLKNLVDQLTNISNSITGNKMFLQLIFGLTKGGYDTIVAFIQQNDPLPSFNKACS